jgi:threonine aldolase
VGLELDPNAVQTNIVRCGLGRMESGAFLAALKSEGVLASSLDAHNVRFVTHLDVDGADVRVAVEAAARAVAAVQVAH